MVEVVIVVSEAAVPEPEDIHLILKTVNMKDSVVGVVPVRILVTGAQQRTNSVISVVKSDISPKFAGRANLR